MIEISRKDARFIADMLDEIGDVLASGYINRLRDQAGPPEPTMLGTFVTAEGIDFVKDRNGKWAALAAVRPKYEWDEFLDAYEGVAGGITIQDPS